MSGGYAISRNTLIDAPAAEVYARIADLRRWRDWSPWENLDPDLTRDYSGAASGVGARYAWSGNKKAGRGTMEIVAATAPTGTAPGVIEVAVAAAEGFDPDAVEAELLTAAETDSANVVVISVG